MLGDAVHEALEIVGLTEVRISAWVGDCRGGCEERRRRLNQLDSWARRVVAGKVHRAREYLTKIMG